MSSEDSQHRGAGFCELVNNSSAGLLATVLVSIGDLSRGCCTSDVASFSTSDGNQGIAAMPYRFMPRAQAQGTAILAAAAPGSTRGCKSDEGGFWHEPKNNVPFSMSHTPLHNLYCTPLYLSEFIDKSSMCYCIATVTPAFILPLGTTTTGLTC